MKKRKKIDWWILGPYLTLSMIGLLEVYSASSYRLLQADENTKSLLLRQLIFIFLSWSVIFLARSVKLHYLLHPKIAGYGLALSIFFLVLVRIGIFGVTVNVTSIFKLPKAVGKLLGSIQTNLPESVLLDCGMDFLKDNNKKIDTLSVPVDGSWDFNDNTPSGSVLELDLTKNQEAIKKFLNN
ncbi:hypothetical protein NNM17_08375 [Enterococcus faecium]|nr:hypothetical protein [Enterococcus faecium]